MIYRAAPHSATLNDPYPRFQGHTIISCWISQERYEIETQIRWNTTPYSTVSFRVTLTDLQRLSKVFDDAKHHAASLRQLSLFLFGKKRCIADCRVNWPVRSVRTCKQTYRKFVERWCPNLSYARIWSRNNTLDHYNSLVKQFAWRLVN